MQLSNLLARLGLVVTYAEARRMVYQGGVKLNDEVIKETGYIVSDGKHLVQVGKNRRQYVELSKGEIVKTYMAI